MNINIGGGRKFLHRGWLNLDGQEGFPLTPDCTFPIAEAEIVYSSHCLEHLDDATVERVLSEARRVCKGLLVLKLPDFEEVLRRWKAGDDAYFQGWGQNGVVPTWQNRRMPDNIHARAAMIFCGYWNDEYGDEWGKRSPNAPGAYHGPVDTMRANSALGDCSPHQIAAFFRRLAPRGAHFNHQNAWSMEELHKLLSRHGFTIDSIDPGEICRMAIPTINDMRGISMYVSAR